MSVSESRSTRAWHSPRRSQQLLVLTLRRVRLTFADRRIVILAIAQPLVMLILFSQVFGSLARPASLPNAVSYIDFLLPALLVTTGIGTAQTAGVGFVRDLEGGMLRRLRSMPCPLWVALAAQALAELARTALQLAVLLLAGLVFFGFSPGGGPLGLLAALFVGLLTSSALIWVFLALAAKLRKVELLSGIGFFVNFPLMFASSAFIPMNALPGWLAAIATVNPVTYAVNACRELALGWDTSNHVVGALVSSAALITVAFVAARIAINRPPGS